MAETKLRKKPDEISEKAAIEYLSKIIKETDKSQKNQGRATKESLLSLKKSLLLLEERTSNQKEMLLLLKELLLERQEVFRQMNESLLEDFNKDLHDDNAVFQLSSDKYLQNHEALSDLQEKQSKLDSILMLAAGASALSFSWNPLLAMVGATGTFWATELSIPIERTVSIMKILLEEFKEEGITITPRVKTEKGLIDLLIRTADGKYFVLLLRSNGNVRVRWREDRQEFYTNGGRTSKWSQVKLLGDELNDRMMCLKTEKSSLFTSNTERKKSFTKAIVLTGKTSLSPYNDPERMVSFGRTTALKMMKESTYYLVDQKNLADFLRKPIEK
jgi:hypothetical protein